MGDSDVRTYRDFTPTFPDRDTWSLPHILRERARTYGQSVLLDFPATGERWTYDECLELSERAASALLAGPMEVGDRLVIMASNRPEVVFAWFAAAFGGLIEVPVNTAYRGSFLEHQIRTVTPTACAIEPEMVERFLEIAPTCESVRRFYVMGDGEDAEAGLALLRDNGWEAEPFSSLFESEAGELPPINPRDPAAIFFTSGTTGPAKGVIMSHLQMAFFADELRCLTRLTDRDTYMATGPMFHGNSQFLAAYPILIAGGRFVLRERFSASNWARWVRNSGVTVTNLIGVMMDFVWKQPPASEDADTHLRCIFAIPTASSIVDAFKRRFGVEEFVESYGMTEVSMPFMTPYGEPYPPGACGLLVEDWFDVRIVNPETDEEVPVGEIGELIIRPKVPWITNSGYYRMPERTAEAYRNLWFHTGDGVRRDHEGWYYFLDRLGDSIRRRGENISSYQVEQAVLEHDAIAECAAVAVPAHEGTEDEIALFVVSSESIQLDEIHAWCEKRLPAFALPRDMYCVEQLPATQSGKIRKSELRELARGLADGQKAA